MLTADEYLTCNRIAQALTSALGKTVKFIQAEPEEFKRCLMDRLKVPAHLADAIVEDWKEINEGRPSPLTDDFKKLTGRKPTSIEEWARGNAKLFQ